MGTNKLKIIADENIPGLEPMFGADVDLVKVAGRTLSAECLRGADVLLVRSVTQVNDALLTQANQLKMVGSATIGTDHINQACLDKRGIPFFSAPGCNANAVAEYVLSVLFSLREEEALFNHLTVGIVGVGNVGGRLKQRLTALGIKVLLNDPPRQAKGEQGFVSLQELLLSADIICCHTPLIMDGDFPTYHLIAQEQLAICKSGALIINAGRGPVIDNQALLVALEERPDLQVVLDVWEHEPRLDKSLVDRVSIGTPHIAGYSLEGKLRGTHMLRSRFAEIFGGAPPADFSSYLPQAAIHHVHVSDEVAVKALIRLVYDPYCDDRALRASAGYLDQAVRFDRLRKHYPIRREFEALVVKGLADSQLANTLKKLGFTLELA